MHFSTNLDSSTFHIGAHFYQTRPWMLPATIAACRYSPSPSVYIFFSSCDSGQQGLIMMHQIQQVFDNGVKWKNFYGVSYN